MSFELKTSKSFFTGMKGMQGIRHYHTTRFRLEPCRNDSSSGLPGVIRGSAVTIKVLIFFASFASLRFKGFDYGKQKPAFGRVRNAGSGSVREVTALILTTKVVPEQNNSHFIHPPRSVITIEAL